MRRALGWVFIIMACGGLMATMAGFAHEQMTGAPSIWKTHFLGSLMALAVAAYFWRSA